MNSSPSVFISWERHRRTTEIGRHFGVEVLTLVSKQAGLRRYLVLTWRTVRELLSRRPSAVIVQSPSLVLCALAEVLAPILRFRLIVDAHYEALTPFVYDYRLVHWGAGVLLRHADVVIVTNDHLRRYVERHGTRALVLPDPLPLVQPPERVQLGPGRHAVFICTFARDEPVEDVMEAARVLGPEVTIHVTGALNARGHAARKAAPANVRFCGYLPEGDYWRLLASVDAVIDLTLIPACLVCGAYEALAICQPLVLSDDLATRETFTTAAAYAGRSPASIASAIQQVLAGREAFVAGVVKARAAYERRWSTAAERFAEELSLKARHSSRTVDGMQ